MKKNQSFVVFGIFIFLSQISFFDALGQRSSENRPSSRHRTSQNDLTSNENLSDDQQEISDEKQSDHSENQQRSEPFDQRSSMNSRQSAQGRSQVLPLMQAIEKAGATDKILLNQRDFVTQDFVQLVADYRKGKADKETIPVLLLHGKKGKKEDWDSLAIFLAQNGMAVLAPDLRGHGASTKRMVEDYSFGDRPMPRFDNKYLVDRFDMSDYEAMIEYDGRLWFQFLILRHNQGKLNIRKLIIIGADLGATIGAAWAKNDWSNKKGQFTKALILLSPYSTDCLPFLEKLKKRITSNSIKMIIFVGGLQNEYLESSKVIQEKIGGKEKAETPLEEQKVPLFAIKTEKEGVELTKVESFKLPQTFLDFILVRIESLKKSSVEWDEIN
ncbi:MAG: alpha/beta fold hydrolase [Planctomycetia bacterium]|nr:alpha/beta fold hydrolase [Planctomycetia bacterium]